MSLFISSVFTYDEDAGNYIQAVEGPSGDNQALEPATRKAINNFVIGCKQDGIWTAIKASCILSGARTLAGALQPLVGTAPTNVGGLFVSGDYNRKTGLVGDGSTKYLDSNRNATADPQDNRHFSVYTSITDTGSAKSFIAARTTGSVGNAFMDRNDPFVRVTNNGAISSYNIPTQPGIYGSSRAASSGHNVKLPGSAPVFFADVSNAPLSASFTIFARDSGASGFAAHRLAFYSIGESLDLALLDARVTDLINAFAVTIP